MEVVSVDEVLEVQLHVSEVLERMCASMAMRGVRELVTLIGSFFFFQAEDGIRDYKVTGVQTCALPISHHARVQFREGHFYLQDVSTNGVYINDDMEPLAKRGSSGYRLADGDMLRMGEYHIVAALEARQAGSEEHTSGIQATCNLVCRLP